MNPVSNASSRRGVTPPPEPEKENEGAAGFTEGPSASRTGRHSVSLAAEGDTLSVASARQDTGATEAAALSHREIVQEAETASGMASTMPVNRTGSEQTQLQRESETVGRLEKPAATPKKKSPNEDQHQAMLELIKEANDLLNKYLKGNRAGSQLPELTKKLEPAFKYINEYDDLSVARDLYRCKAYSLYFDDETAKALVFFKQAEELHEDHVNLSEGLLIMQLMLGINTNNRVFRPEEFYKELEVWSRPDTIDTVNIIDGEELAQLLASQPGGVAHPGTGAFFDGVKLFRRGIRTILEEKNINSEASRTTFEQTFARLARYSDGDQSLLLKNSDRMLKFARDLTLLKNGCFHEALKSAMKNETGKLEHLNDYIYCRALEAMGDIDGAIQRCMQCTSSGYQVFSNYLKTLESSREQGHVYGDRDYQPACLDSDKTVDPFERHSR